MVLKDVNISKGKMAAQVAHAKMGLLRSTVCKR